LTEKSYGKQLNIKFIYIFVKITVDIIHIMLDNTFMHYF
jgi:hypothetical protein